MITQKSVTDVLAAVVLASAGLAATTASATAQTISQATETVMIASSNISVNHLNRPNATESTKHENRSASVYGSSKPTFRRPAFMTWSWLINHRHRT